MSLFPTNYRLAMLSMIANFFGRPLVFALLIATFLLPGYGLFSRILVYILCIPGYWSAQNQYNLWVKKREAAARGAVLAPEIKGKWIGNIDLMIQYVFNAILLVRVPL